MNINSRHKFLWSITTITEHRSGEHDIKNDLETGSVITMPRKISNQDHNDDYSVLSEMKYTKLCPNRFVNWSMIREEYYDNDYFK